MNPELLEELETSIQVAYDWFLSTYWKVME